MVVATAVAFPQKSKSYSGRHKKSKQYAFLLFMRKLTYLYISMCLSITRLKIPYFRPLLTAIRNLLPSDCKSAKMSKNMKKTWNIDRGVFLQLNEKQLQNECSPINYNIMLTI